MAKPPNGGRRISRRETERSKAPSSNGEPGEAMERERSPSISSGGQAVETRS